LPPVDVSDYYHQKEKNETSSFYLSTNKIALAPPLLNITNLLGVSPHPDSPVQNADAAWINSGEPYTATYIRSQGNCQALTVRIKIVSGVEIYFNTTQHYQWGFSFIQLNLMLLLLIMWTVGTYTMWLSAHITMKQRGRKQVAGEYKAILELANAMQIQLLSHSGSSEKTTANMSESELRRRIAKDIRGGAISYETPLLSNGEDGCGNAGRGAVTVYLKRETWWLVALVVSVVTSIIVGVYYLLPVLIFIVGITVSLIVTICVGSTHKSKGIILWWSFWALAVLPQLIAILTMYFKVGTLQLQLAYGQW
jgi:hypothetical protein